jgi:aspartate/methionine/tyrosine aminotransferase
MSSDGKCSSKPSINLVCHSKLPYSKLAALTFASTVPQGAYFVLINVKRLKIPDNFEVLDQLKNRSRDWHAAWFFAQEAGVVAIPCGDFYSDDHADMAANYVRLAFVRSSLP